MPVWLTAIFKALASIFGLLQEKQLLDAGRAMEQRDVFETDKKAAEEMAKDIEDIRAISDAELDDKLFR